MLQTHTLHVKNVWEVGNIRLVCIRIAVGCLWVPNEKIDQFIKFGCVILPSAHYIVRDLGRLRNHELENLDMFRKERST